MRILITGAAGFLGSHLADRAIASGHQVIAVDNFLTGREINLAHLQGNRSFQLLNRDVIAPLELDGPVDWILHFASPASPPKYLRFPVETMRVNGEGTLHLLELAQRKKAGFLLASTSEVYGDPMVHPQVEGYWGNVNSVGPRAVYDESKRFAEALTANHRRQTGLPTRIIRIFNTYGPRMDPEDGRVVSNFICQALRNRPIEIYGDGRQTRSFQFVDDLVEGIFRLLEVDYSDPVNLGNPQEFTIADFAHLVKARTGSASSLVFKDLPVDDPRRRCPDISLARRILGWSPRVSIEEGLGRTIEYFQQELRRAG
ncbi:MAG TPA: UDP-glucuronic acid decarboxylase family protein [bacterium]|nr:UDP-glucuronic acid decarboxylase family protein [bacterium]